MKDWNRICQKSWLQMHSANSELQDYKKAFELSDLSSQTTY